jgi:hypothetical protein
MAPTLKRHQLRFQGHLDIIVRIHCHLGDEFGHWREGEE